MNIIKRVKNFLKIKKALRVESIETYEDVNLFLAGYKYYFEKLDSWYFIDRVNRIDQVIMSKIGCRYFVGDNNFYEPNIRAYIWDNRDIINAELKRQKERSESKEKEQIRKKELENQIKKTAI